MTDPAFRFDGQVPVFPLPNVVFFPRTVLPLHIFEARYRRMVKDAAEGERLIAVSLLLPGWEKDYEGSPAFHAVATLGRIDDLTPLPGGRFDLKLVGLARVRLGEVLRFRPYRTVRACSTDPPVVDEEAEFIRDAKRKLLACHGCLLRALVDEDGPGTVLDEEMSFEAAVNGTCANLPVDPQTRQALLELDDLLERERRASCLLDSLLERVLRLKALRAGDGALNFN